MSQELTRIAEMTAGAGQVVQVSRPTLTFTANKEAGFTIGAIFSIEGYPRGFNGEYRVDSVRELDHGSVQVESTQLLGDADLTSEIPAIDRMRAPDWAEPLAPPMPNTFDDPAEPIGEDEECE